MNDKPNIPEKLLSSYNPKETETRIYEMWEESGFFNPDILVQKGIVAKDAEPFSIVLPPPNVTGTLHTGHALMLVIEDIMTRYARMKGKKTLWVPGTDHAAIATQSKVEKLLEKEGVKKADLGREEFLKRVNEYAMASHDTIVSQARKMGASLDWSREAFTLDEARTKAVYTAFTRMYNDGLIYRGYRIVNWDPKGQTVISDDEVVYEERKAKLYTFKYSKDFPISISTTRPETKVGDTAVAVNPDDERYKEFVGKEYDAVFCGVPIHIKIVADESVEKEFGTGALGVTPAHSHIDWEIAQRHKLPIVPVINEYAKMIVGDEQLLGKKTTDAREIVVEWLKQEGLLEKEEEITQNISTAERTGAVIEPIPKLQWFIDVNKKFAMKHSEIEGVKEGDEVSLKDLMRKVVENKQTTILPDRFEKVYYHWIDNLRDWCISRQIWYGHRIPVWYDKDGKEHLPKTIKVLLARHGQSEFNKSPVFLTQKEADETPLTEKGREDAKMLGESLKGVKVTKIIRSDLLRAKETAEIVAKEIGWDLDTIEVWEDLREARIGENYGVKKPADYNPLKFSIENGIQTLEEVEAQGKKVLDKLKTYQNGDTVLVIGHGAIHSVFLAMNCDIPKEKFVAFKSQIGVQKNGSWMEMNLLVPPTLKNLEQDQDTLDTWFSSGLWTFSTLGWPNETPDLKTFHPTSVLETGHDILFFWIARMILMSTYHTGQIPFSTVYLHGMVRTADGKKMSKSLGEKAIDPLDLIERYGTDALRMACIVGVGPGNDLKLDENNIRGYSKFANKIWNAARFVIENTLELGAPDEANLDQEDKASYDELKTLMEEIMREMDEFKFYLVSEKLYHYFWHTFADILIERSKTKIANGNTLSAQTLLSLELDILLRALHPFMPFITEELWSLLPDNRERMLMVTSWPTFSR